MTGFGPLEILIVVAIAALLFGAPVVTFLLGYGLGRRKAASQVPESTADEQPDEGTVQDG